MSQNYFISYHMNVKGGWAFGMCECATGAGINEFADIKKIAESIQNRIPDCTNIIILNWREIDPPGEQEGHKP